MRPVAPRIDGCPEITLAENQTEYAPITVAVVDYESGKRGLMTRWRPSDEERAQIANGEDIYVGVMTFGGPMQPISVHAGIPEEWRT